MADEEKDVLYKLDIDAARAIKQVDMLIERLLAVELVGDKSAKAASASVDKIAAALAKRLNLEKQVEAQVKKTLGTDEKRKKTAQDLVKTTEESTKALAAEQQAAKDKAEREKELAAIAKSRAALNRQFLREQALATREQAKAEQQRVRTANALNRQYIQEQNRAQQAVLRLIKTYPQEAAALRAVAHEFGNGNVRIGESVQKMNDYEQAVNRVIQRNPQLAGEIKKLSQGFSDFSLNLERGTFDNVFDRAGLSPFQVRQLAQGLDRLGLRGVSAFADIATTAGVAGIAVGGIILAMSKLISVMVQLTKKAAETFAEFTKGSVDIAAKFDSISASLLGVFGDEGTATGVLKAIRQESIRLGVDVEEIVRKMLPLVDSLSDLLGAGGISELAVGLAQLDPKLGEQGAVRVLQAAAVGNTKPLKQSFDIDTTPIVKAQKELGNIQGLVVGLGEVLRDRGLDFDTLGNTFARVSGSIKQQWEDIKFVTGEPIVDELIEQFKNLLDIVSEGEGDIQLVFRSLGEGITLVVRKVGELTALMLESFSSEQAEKLAEALFSAGMALAALVEHISGLSTDAGGFGLLADLATGFANSLHLINALLAYMEAAGSAAFAAMAKAMYPVLQGALLLTGQFKEYGDELFILAHTDPMDVFKQSLEESKERLNEFWQETGTASENVARFRKELEHTGEEALETADSIIRLNAAQRAVADTAEAAAEAAEKIQDAREEEARDFAQEIIDINREYFEDLADMEEDFSQKRADIARKWADELKDIRTKTFQDIADAEQDLTDDEADIMREYARDVLALDEELADKRIENEKEFRRKLDEIRRKYAFQEFEAILANDAAEYLRIQRRKAFELEEERIKNDEQVTDAEDAAEDKRRKLKQQLEYELEDARIANERKLRDIGIAFEREVAAHRLKLEREIRDQIIAEERKRDEVEKSHQRAIEEANRQHAQKMADMQRRFEEEYAAIRAHEEAKLTLILEYAKRAASIPRYTSGGGDSGDDPHIPNYTEELKKEAADLIEKSSLSDNQKDKLLRELTNMTVSQLRSLIESLRNAMGAGGNVFPDGSYLVGENGPEIFKPAVPGSIIPNNQLPMYAPPGGFPSGVTNVFNQQRRADVNMNDPTTFSPEQFAMLESLFARLMMSS